MMRDSSSSGTYQIMDASRMLAALVVALSHIRDLLLVDYSDVPSAGLTIKAFYAVSGLGHIGVIIFFVLSGFWITQSVIKRSESGLFWLPYLIDRVSRLWIVLIPALVIGGLLDIYGIHYLGSSVYKGLTGAHSIDPNSWRSLTPSIAFGNALFLMHVSLPTFGSNGPLWSLAFEFWYYIWFPALWLAVRHRRYSIALLAFLIGLANWQVAVGFISWLMGSALYALVSHTTWQRLTPLWRKCGLLSGFLAFAAAVVWARAHPSVFSDPVLAAAFAWFLAGIFLFEPSPSRLLQPVARYGAGSSFSLYVLHYPVAAIVAAVVAAPERMQPNSSSMTGVLAVLVLITIAGKAFSSRTEARTDCLRNRARLLLLRGANN